MPLPTPLSILTLRPRPGVITGPGWNDAAATALLRAREASLTLAVVRYDDEVVHVDSGLSTRDIDALDAAKLYYSGLSQDEVAQRMHLARSTISKLLSHARKRGFVRITVNDPREDDAFLCARLSERFNLLDVRLVSPPSSAPEDMREALGRVGAQVLSEQIRDGDAIGICLSRTTEAVSRHMPRIPRKGVAIIQLTCCIGACVRTIDETMVMERIAASCGGQAVYFQLPAFLSAQQREDPGVKARLRATRTQRASTRVVLYTVGDARSNLAYLAGFRLEDADMTRLLTTSVGDICTHFITAQGRICLPDLNNRATGISLPELREKEQKILVAGGPDKLQAIYAALANGYVSRLVTDVGTARALTMMA
ncbi:hypothetical protein HMPREF9237_01169 [Actinotignum schaalii FB123-CNA-2]|uniref:Sugar-binding domain-containing protein n=1 Tax=Actinotignum schaalii FB123-CNA-2 TaxID=883067 RepID=S2VKM3_9ACTO|nr:hypothetical protein HMPREF9237_01169 [Actinotignum schaalii FB123-CNA-2]